MTLLTTPTLQSLYHKARQSDSLEHETITFWNHLLSKIYFGAEHFVITPQVPSSSALADRLRKVDLGIGKINVTTGEFAAIAFVEGKRTNAREEDYERVEGQCYEACEAHMHHHTNRTKVYGICVVGTKAQVFLRELGNTWNTRTNSYLDANGPGASKLHDVFNEIVQSAV